MGGDYLVLWTDCLTVILVDIKNGNGLPNPHGSAGCVSGCKAKGHWFDSQSEHVPGLQVQSLVRVSVSGDDGCSSLISMFLSLCSPFLPFSLKINTQNLEKNLDG